MEVSNNDLYLNPRAGLVDSSAVQTRESKVQSTATSGTDTETSTDSAVINSDSISGLVNLASDSPGATARSERVESLKAKIQSGDYKVSSSDIADDQDLIDIILG